MSISNLVYNAVSDVKHGVEGGLQGLTSQIDNLIGQATATFSSLWDGGFVGISGDTSELIQEIDNHIKSLHGIVESFNTNAYINDALQGQTADAATQYVNAIKDLINAYCSTYEKFKTLLQEQGVEGMSHADESNQAEIDQRSDEIRGKVQDILSSIK